MVPNAIPAALIPEMILMTCLDFLASRYLHATKKASLNAVSFNFVTTGLYVPRNPKNHPGKKQSPGLYAAA